MATNYYQDPFGAPDYSAEGMPSLLSLSNLESLGRGSVAGLLDLPYMIEGMLRGDVDPRMPQRRRVVPSSEQVLATTPRMTQPTPQAGLLETAGAFMSPAPVAAVKPVAKAVGRGGKAVARMAGEEINAAIMGERGGLLGAVTPQPMFLDVYHGTPHTLPPTERNPLGEFDASKIGTGEGGQAYGYGIYTAESPDVARTYQNRLSKYGELRFADGTVKNVQDLPYGSPEQIAGQIWINKPNLADAKFALSNLDSKYLGASKEDVLKQLESLDAGKAKLSGNFYKVDLPDEKIATMLDWDKPVSQQKNVMGALRKEAEQRVKNRLQVDIENDIRSKIPSQNIGNDYMALFGDQNIAINQDIRQQALDRLNKLDLKPLIEQELNSFKTPDMTWDMSGRDLYQLLSQRSGSPQQASGLLQSQGIAGIRYLDSQSRPTNITNIRLADLYQKYKGNAEAAVDEFMRSVYNTPKKKAEMRKQFLKELEAQKTSNFVVFPGEEKNMTILERNGMRGLLD
jgi:hypothetical protein